jgi:hypothetical protein
MMPLMPYSKFVQDILDEVNRIREEEAPDGVPDLLTQEVVKEVLNALPFGFMDMPEGYWVRTPFGVFKMTRQKQRSIALPTSKKLALVEEKLIVKLKSGKRLQFPVTPDPP